jgi:hypothetical protein
MYARESLNIATPNHADNNATIMHNDNVAAAITSIYIDANTDIVHTPTSADDNAQNTPTATDETQPTPTVTTKIHIDDDAKTDSNAKPKPTNNAATPILEITTLNPSPDEEAKAKLLLANHNAKIFAEVDADAKISPGVTPILSPMKPPM